MHNLFDISGRVAVVTGGYGVLGGSMAECLAEAGVKVGILGRRQEAAEARAATLRSQGGQALALTADVIERSQVLAAREQVLAAWGRIDILINAAGGNRPAATIGPDQNVFDLSMEAFDEVTDLNLKGTVIPTLIFGETMAEQHKGSILNISSMAAQQAVTKVVGYSVAKAGVDLFTKWMAVEMARQFGPGMRVNAIAPGFFIADQNRDLLIHPDGSYTERGKTIIAHTPLGRFGVAEELHGVVRWLCSDAASFVTGVVVPVDGGFSAFSGV